MNYIDPSGHSGIGKFLSDAWNGFTGFVSDVVDTVVDAGKKAVDTVTGWFEDKDSGKNKDSDRNNKTQTSSNNKDSKPKTDEKPLQDVLDVYTTHRTQTAEIEQKILEEQTKILCSDEAKAVYAGVGATLATVLLAPYLAALLAGEIVVTTTAGWLLLQAGTAGFVYGGTYTGLKSLMDGETVGESMASAYEDGVIAAIIAMVEAGYTYILAGMPVTNTPGKIDVFPDGITSGTSADNIWDMPEGGSVINGREYSQHALERMAPDTPQVRAELSRRAEKKAEELGYKVGTAEYFEFCENYVNPRNIPPSVVEDAITSTKGIPGNQPGTFIHETMDVKVVVNSDGKVITVIPK